MGQSLDDYLGARAPESKQGDPPWNVALLFPVQGDWTEDEYLSLSTNRFVELSKGRLEVHPLPTDRHQAVATFFMLWLRHHVLTNRLGRVRKGPLPMRLGNATFREPDVLFMRAANLARCHQEYWDGADLVAEVLTSGRESRMRDLKKKRKEYAAAGIAEYWIIDPEKSRVVVLSLEGKKYVMHEDCGSHGMATSELLPGFEVEVSSLLAAD